MAALIWLHSQPVLSLRGAACVFVGMGDVDCVLVASKARNELQVRKGNIYAWWRAAPQLLLLVEITS